MTDTAPPLTKHETVMERTEPLYPSVSTTEVFANEDTNELVQVSHSNWVEVGRPEQVTVAIWPGDRLNDHPHTKAARTDAPVPDDVHADMPCHG